MADIFLVRQPVYDKTETAVGYELRFRDSGDEGDAFARSFLSGGFDVVRGGLPAWVRASERELESEIFMLPDPKSLVVLLPPDLPATDDLITNIAKLAARGIVVALDEFQRPQSSTDPVLKLLPHAGIVRIDLRAHDVETIELLVSALKKQHKMVVADHVFDAKTYGACVAAGFDGFQGPHFARPEPLPSSELPTSTVAALRVIAMARNPNVTEHELERAISSDPAITFQLLRIVNSASEGGRGISSIAHALRLAGRATLVRWLALAAYASRAGKSGITDELTRQAVQRGFFSEELAKRSPGHDAGTAFLVGLFSLLDAVFRVPLSDVLERINLAGEVKSALLDRQGPYADTLQVIESYELGLWESAGEGARALGIDPSALPEIYTVSLTAAEELVPSARTADAQ